MAAGQVSIRDRQPNNSMDVRAKQRLSYYVVRQTLADFYSVSPHVISAVRFLSVEKHFSIREATENDKEQCESVLRALPEWFGIESAIAEYVLDIRQMLTYVVISDERVDGFLSLNQHNPHTAEIHVMAVRREFHRSGMGNSLMETAENVCREKGIEYLEVKTLGGSRENEYYDRTRRFYFHCGFRPLEEIEGIWEGNPCLLMVKKL